MRDGFGTRGFRDGFVPRGFRDACSLRSSRSSRLQAITFSSDAASSARSQATSDSFVCGFRDEARLGFRDEARFDLLGFRDGLRRGFLDGAWLDFRLAVRFSLFNHCTPIRGPIFINFKLLHLAPFIWSPTDTKFMSNMQRADGRPARAPVVWYPFSSHDIRFCNNAAA